ncbi:MAG: hypothetical protein ACPK7O_08700 [Methanobacterium sp.]
MSNGNQGKQIGNNEDIMKAFETTEEYKSWLESLFAIIGYTSNEEEDEELAAELIADHLNASFALQKGLDSAKYKSSKKIHDDWLLDNSGQ